MNNTNDKFNRTAPATTKTTITNNKISATLERFSYLRGTEVESLLKTFMSIITEADRHIAIGDSYFDYVDDRTNAYARVNLMITMIYRNEGNIDKIYKDICYKNGKAESAELSDHYWAIPHNN